jgi:hypothetical protein
MSTANDLRDTHVLLLCRLLEAYWHLDNSVQCTQQVRNSHLAYLDNSAQFTKQARNTQLAYLDNSVRVTKQARNTHLAYLGNLRLWNLLVAGLSWDCWGHDSGGCYSCRRKRASCFVSGAHSQGGNHLYTGTKKKNVKIFFFFKLICPMFFVCLKFMF